MGVDKHNFRSEKKKKNLKGKEQMKILCWVCLVFVITNVGALSEEPQLSSARVVFQVLSLSFDFTFLFFF